MRAMNQTTTSFQTAQKYLERSPTAAIKKAVKSGHGVVNPDLMTANLPMTKLIGINAANPARVKKIAKALGIPPKATIGRFALALKPPSGIMSSQLQAKTQLMSAGISVSQAEKIAAMQVALAQVTRVSELAPLAPGPTRI